MPTNYEGPLSTLANFTHRICERCWFDGPGRLEDDMVRLPVQVKDPDDPEGIGTCCFCAGPCVTGIYTRKDPRLLDCQMRHGPDD